MNETKDNTDMRKDPKVLEKIDEYTQLYVSNNPMRGKKDEFKSTGYITYSWCGVCGKRNTKLIHKTSGATFDGTVNVWELQCLDCGCFTMYHWSDRM